MNRHLGVIGRATEASAATVSQYCDILDGPTACLNAWGGGPYVNVEESNDPRIQNNRFQVLPEANGNFQIQFLGGGQYNGYCIGDEGNVSGNATAGLVVCNTHTGAGWAPYSGTGVISARGTRARTSMHIITRTGAAILGRAGGYVNGSHFYLNKPNLVCFARFDTN